MGTTGLFLFLFEREERKRGVPGEHRKTHASLLLLLLL
jgi:hypothetical protein